MDVTMRMPDVDSTGSEVRVLRWLAEIGAAVKRGDPLVEVETGKAVMELESVITGILRAVSVEPGQRVAAGQVIATFDAAGAPDVAGGMTHLGSGGANIVSPPHGGGSNTNSPPYERGGGGGSAPYVENRTPTAPERASFFARNRQAQPSASPSPEAGHYEGAFLFGLYERMVSIREFEDGVKFLFLEGSMPGTIHQCQGQEGTAVGVCAALGAGDFITSTFRGHGHALAQGLTVEELLFELFGADTGCCRGKGGSMHVGNMDKGMVPGIAIVGGGVPLAAGMALAFKMQGKRHVVACFFGDGAVAEGAFHEGVNLAAIWDLPVIFVCENNLYGASTRVDRVMRNPRISDRAASYGIRGQTVDGNDVLAVYEAARIAADECRNGCGPVLLELLTYRRTGHSRRDACHYQPLEEREAWLRRDPIDRLGELLCERGLADQAALDQVRARVVAHFQAAIEEARRQPLPTVDDLTTDVLA
ncbi:MAG: thiamine pyrophosphate-dependent enzyme [Isosphaeraceae bacterium]|nr:thiamine pyrophosphate-dependent enzyme [Isosphaeraceae bacterium]